MNNRLLKTAFLLSISLLLACTSTEEKIDDLLLRHLDSFVFVEGGSFMMGNPGGWSVRPDTIPAHKVTLDSFSIQKYEVTQGDMDLFMEVTGYVSNYVRYDKRRNKHANRFIDELPAVSTWDDARAFCQWLGKLSNKSIDLPSEAQWEYAARSRGKMVRFATDTGKAIAGVNMAKKPELGVADNSALPLPPGNFPPNPLGLYDMSGNAVEWVLDNYQPDYYQRSPEHNPQGPETGQIAHLLGAIYQQKVARGGSFYDYWGNTTVSKLNVSSGIFGLDTGLRCRLLE